MKACVVRGSALLCCLLCGVLLDSRWRAAAQAPAGGAGLQGYYFAGRNFEELRFVRVDAGVNCDWNAQSARGGFPA